MRRQWRLSPAGAGAVIITLLALGLRLYRVTRPGLLAVSEYDDGVYFGSAVRLVHGVLPYQDFILVHPAGITLLMGPVAVLSNAAGTAAGLAVARILTVLASASAVVLGSLVVRHRGLLAVLVTCGTLAIYPGSVFAAHTVMLEPWLVLACLAGAVAIFDRDHLAGPRRLAWGGAAFGVAGAIKVWAIAPVLAVLALCLLAGQGDVSRIRRVTAFGGGVAASFAVLDLPFAVLAPQRFYRSVVVAQLGRVGPRISVWHRLQDMIGIFPPKTWSHESILAAALTITAAVVAAHVAASLATRRGPAPLDCFALVTAALVVAMFLWPPYFADHYTAFLGPFLGLAFALPMARLVTALAGSRSPVPRGRIALGLPWLATVLAVLTVLAAALALAAGSASLTRRLPTAEIQHAIPAGACVLSDQVSYLLLSGRFLSPVPGCPQMVDSLGVDLTLSGGRVPATGASRVPALVARWRVDFGHSQYVLLSSKNTQRIPWTPGLRSYFRRHFALVLHGHDYAVYAWRHLPRR
jgi:hypothetical protein